MTLNGSHGPLFDHLVGDRQDARRNSQAKRFCSFQVDDKTETSRQRDWKVRRCSTLQDAAGIKAALAELFGQARAITDQAARYDVFAQ
jgi:hypothetical protein